MRPHTRFKKRVRGESPSLRETNQEEEHITKRQLEASKHAASNPTPTTAPAEAEHINLYEDSRCQEWLDYCPDITPKDNRCFKDMKGKCTTPKCPQVHSKFNHRSSKACSVRLKRKEWCEAAYTPEGCRSNHFFKRANKATHKTDCNAPRDSTATEVFTSGTTDPKPKTGATTDSNNSRRTTPENPLHTAAMSELTTRMRLLPSIHILQTSHMHTRGDLAKALKALISHAKAETAATDHHSPRRPSWQSTCWPCAKARQSLEKRSQIQNIHLNAVLAKTSRPCSTIISELLRHVIANQASITSTKRGACIAAHSIYIHTKEQSDAATQDLHEALLSTVVAQLAAPDTGRYQGTIKNIILAATTPQDKPAPRTQNNLAAHFLRLATATPLPNLSESARRFTIEIIREHASISPDSD